MASVKMPFVLNLSVILFFLPAMISTALLKQDQSALLALKSKMHDPLDMLATWDSSYRIPVCNWTRVICSARHQRVVSLNLSYVGLQGSIAPEIGNLSFLTYLDFSSNSLRGDLPQEMMHLRRLKYMDLTNNSFGGDVPSWIGSLPNLQVINLSNNSFTGAVPASLFNASKLGYLNIRYNGLQGNIPSQISQNDNLWYLNLCGNRISGSFPQSILNLTYLQNIDLTKNSLSGNLPLDICSKIPNLLRFYSSANQLSGRIQSVFHNCSQLLVVAMAVNHFDGVIPREIGNLTTLTRIFLGTNNFTGDIPSEIGNLLNLEVLNIQENVLTGKIPEEIGNLQKLDILALSVNRLSGVIPLTILNMSSITAFLAGGTSISGIIPHDIGLHQLHHLQILALGGTSLSGVIPDSVSNLTELTVLELSYNHLTGSIPPSLGTLRFLSYFNLEHNHLSVGSSPELSFLASLMNCSNLAEFYVSMNPLKGTFPSSIDHFSSSLKVFQASFCEFEGNIPPEMGNLSGLIELNLGGNLNLDGAVPIEFQNLLNLQRLDLNGNKISGPIPNYFCNFKKLGFLHLGDNQFTGQVPECFQDMNSLRYLFLYSNKLDATLPPNLIGGLVDLLYLDVHSNSLKGDIPKGIGNMKATILIDLSNNSFSGLIPISIGFLNNLINLSLSHNQLQGSIPEKLTGMLNLESLDLSHNNLTGHIPISLASLLQLKYFNISFNKIEGKIPSNGSFQNFPYESFMSNGAFCDGPPHLQLPPCPSHSTHKSSAKMLHLLTHVLIPVSLGIFMIVFTAIMCIKKRKQSKSSPSQIDERISFYELHHATNGFNESNLLASGSYGSVYKGVLRDGTLIAAKVFNLEKEGSYKSFDRECEVLRNVRHRNLVKVITSCSNLDFKALVLEYMPNGSLEKWLYSHNYFLDFSKRLDIMIDVASALAYLHYGYSVTIVHCDLKPSNVLLDEDMTGRVCDFGIAKLFASDERMAQTNTLATFGYIAPEYGFEGKVSTSCDVYSFGILLMETFSRKKPSDEMFSGDWGLKEWVGNSLKYSSTNFIDENLMNVQDKISETLVQCASEIMELALRCTEESVDDRCDIKLALEKLEKIKRHFPNSKCVQNVIPGKLEIKN